MNVVNIGGVNGSGKKKKYEKKKSSSSSATTSGAKAKTSSSKSSSSTTKTGGGIATANTGAGRRTKTVGGSASAYTGAGRRTNTASQKTAGSGNTSKSTSSTTSAKSNNNFFSPGSRGGGVKQNLSKYKNSKIYSKWEDMSDSDKEFAFRNSNSSANKWAEEASSVLSDAESHYSTYRKDTGKKSLDYQAKINRLISGGQYWKKQYKGNSDAVHKINSIMQALESGDSYVRDMSRYYFQFDNENSYKESQELNKLYNMSSSELEGHLKDKNPIAYTTLSGQNITWKNLYDSRTKEENFNVLYNNLSSMSDWEKMSQYRSTQGSGMIPFLPADAEHEWINDPVTKVSERTSDLSGYKYVANQMTDEERAIFNYLYNKSGKDRAYAFMDSIQSELKKRQENANIQSAIRLAKEVPVLPSVASFVTNLLSPIEYAYDALDYYVFGELTGRDTIDTNHAAALTSAIRGTVSENTDWMIGDWDAHDFLYSTAMSGVDSLIASGIYGIGGGISLGLSAAAQATNDALSKGQTNKQAFLSGLVSGVFESLWESVSIGKFKALKDVTPKSIKDVVKNIGKQMLVNASEEFNTEVANIVYDSLANGAFSDYESSVRAYMQSGMSESEARTKAASDLAFQTIEAAASGALMGAGFGGIGSIQGYINGGKVASDIYGSDPAALINESLEIDPNNTLALKLKEKLDKGKNISGMELNQLVQKNERTMNRQDTAAIQKAVSDRLTELGETGDIEALSIALTKRFSGKKLSNSENALIQNSQYGTRVSYEMNPTNIQSGDYASEWAENIGTNRINPEEYSRIVKASQITQDTQGAEDSSVTADTDFDAPARAQDTETASAENQDSVQPEIDEHAAPDVQEAAVPAAQTLEEASEKYGEQADAMLQTYSEGQDVDEYDAAYRIAYDMGESGIPFDYVNRYAGTSYLTADQRKAAYEAGVSSAATSAGARDSEIKQGANGKTGWKQGVVSGEGVTGDDLQKAFNMNSTQVRAYNILTDIAKATGLNIVLYKSSADKNGKLVGAQGKYNHSEPGTLYIDLNAGLSKIQGADDLGKYTMLRTFSHEFTHFIENWNPSQYNVLRKAVFEAIDERSAEDGLSAHEIVMKKMDNGLSYEAASREVTAEALTDILPDANFVETLAQKHKSVFEMLRDKLKEFAAKIREYFENIGDNPSREARALKQSGHYVDSIVKLFDNVAVQAVENYQSNYAVDETSSAENSAESKAAEKTPSEPKAKVQAEPYVSENGYTITDNAEYGSIEVKFDSKPKQEVLDALKANKFRWNGKRQIWYGKTTHEAIREALDRAYAAEASPAEEPTPPYDFETSFRNAPQEERDEVVEAINRNTMVWHVAPTEIREEVPADTEAKHVETTLDNAGRTPSEKLASKLLEQYLTEENINRGGKALTAKELYALADEAFGGTQAEGAYNRKDAYDAMELAVNKFLLQYAQKANRTFNGNAQSAISAVEFMQDMLDLLPTQNVRTQEQQDFQQFSTPPNIAYLAAWAANINSSDMVLEPSAGIGGLAVFAKAWGAEVAVNELSTRRLGVLRSMGFDHLFNENAEQIDNILPENISPSVVIMNPPFSSTAGRTANNKTSNAEKHIDQALARLRDGGRLVAVLGKSMNNQDYYRYWDKLRKNFNIRANLSIDGSNYKKYGTTWGVQIVVIDKTGPQTGETVTGRFTDLTEVPKVLEGIRNDRRYLEENRIAGSDNGIRESVADGGNARNTDTGNFGSNQRTDGSAAGSQRTENREVSERNPGTGNRTDRKTDAKTGSQTAERKGGGTDRIAGRADTGDGNGAVKPGDADRHQPELPLSRLSEQEEVSDDGVYATFIAPDIPVKGGKKHPAVLVESAAMAAVSMPKATYTPKLPADVVKNNLSDAQLVTVTYAGQAHEQTLPDGRRKGFFIGDGTGVGKGRQIAGIILDNFMQGRTKAVWISKNNDLYGDAIRDWTATTGRGKDEVISQSKLKPKDKISMQSGILYSTYDTIKSEKGGSRLDQIVEWLGEDFDGVIAFDEAHNMGNLFGKKGKFGKSKGSEKAKAGVELQRRLPNARIVYVSATAATEVDNLAYAERLGLWGQGTAFSDAKDFISKIGSSGLAAMELVIRDMKAMGSYVARSISYNGVNYDTVEHTLDPMQTEIYNTMSRAWQKTMQNVQSALETTGGRYNSNQRQKALGNFYSSMQRFYNQVLTSMSMPSVIADMRKELAAGHSCVLQIVNTNEAQQNKALAEAKASGESLDNLDLTPREALVGYLTNSFPTQMYEEYTDEDGNLRSRPVLDSAGNPVQSKEAIRQRDALIAEVNQMSIPDGPLEMLFDAFGPEAVAENTGRSRRVVPRKQADGSISRVEERRTLNHRTADVQAFQDGKKRILVFSDAGGTGKSYHADRSEKNQQQRIHYVLQPGWVASNAVQGFGRTHRSNETSAPIYKLVTTNIKGQKRFTSTIARRLDQLGALTKGQRDTGSGMFGAKDNLETDLAKDSLREFYLRLGKNQIEGIDGMKILERLGLKQKFTDEYGSFKINDNLARDIGTFLNRILALEVDEQNVVFDAFISIYEMELEAAIQAGTLDTGMENVKADRIEVVDDKVIREDKTTGAATHYIQAKTYTKPKIVTTVAEMEQKRSGFEGIYKTESGAVKAVYRIADKTTEWGAVQKQYRLVGPNQGAKTSVWGETGLKNKAEPVPKTDWQKEWDAEVAKVPEYNEDTLHMLTGALLPIWNNLPQDGNTKVKRLIAHDGSTYLGRVIGSDMIDGVLKGFSIGRTMETFTAQQVVDKAIQNGIRFQLTNDKAQIFRSRVSGEWRLEISQPYNSWYLTKRYPDIIQERIQYRDRYFIPVGEKGISILEKLLSDNPVRSTVDDSVQEQSRAYLSDEAEVFRDNEEQNQSREYLEDVDTITNSPVTQAISSAKTSIKQIPALFKDKNVHFKETNVDIGGGKFDLATEFLSEQGVKNYLFDPYNRSENINLSTLDFLRSGNRADTATCANVLNVIAEPAARANVILEAAKAIKNDGTAYFMVYEGDGSGTGRETSSGWQNNRKTADYVGEIAQYFNSVVRKGKLIIATDPVSDLPKAAWEISPGNAIQYQQRTDTLTDREVLSLASSQIANEDLTSEERSVLGIFDTRIHELYELQEKRREQGRIYKEQQFGTNVDREEAEKTRNRMKVLDGQIERASSRVLEVENKAVLKRILQRARKIVEQNQREHDQAIIKRRIDRMNNAAAIRKYRTRIQTDTNELTKWVLHPNNKSIVKHIPDAIKDTVIPFLESIDFTSKQQLNGGKATKADKEFEKQLKALKNVLNENINVEGLYSGYNDLPPNFMDNLQTFMDAVHSVVEKNTGTFVINEMSSEELHELSKIVRTLKKYIMDMNTFHNNAMFQHTYEAGDNSIEYMNGLKSAGNTGAVSNFLFWQQMRPAYAFERFGKGGIAIYDELRRGQAALAFNTKKIIDFSQNTYTEKEVKAWEKETHTFELGDDLVKIPVSGIMSLYELSKRPQGLQHILGGGIRVATYKDGKNKISDTGHTVTLEEVNRITETLTPRQKEVADALQKFMAEQGGEWGNYVSVKRFGESLFGEKNYFPINSDGRHLQAEADEKPGAASLYALLNMGFTKELNEKANNRVVLYSIFDVFANHMASMAQYNALALPVLDALKWFNYKQSDAITGQPSTSVRDEMNRVFGTPEETRPGAGKKGYAENFVINILKAYNGTEAQGAPMDSIGLKMLHKYNRAQLAFNFRVVVQQPLAITRAGMLIDYRSILRGMKLSPSAIRKNISEMQQYSGIAAWKSLGFYDVNISRGLTSLIKHDESKMDKFIEIGMAGAEKADTLTWAAMWSACKEEVMRKQKLKPGDNGFFEAVTELFENVIYKTQVVDSVLTKNEFIRDKGLFARTVGSFMSEPTTTASMLLDTVDKMNMDRKSGLSFQQTWKKNGKAFARTVYVYAIGAVLLASVQAAADALRDDDDYEDFLEKWLEAFKGDLIDEANPFNKLPILSDLSDLVKEILAQWTDLDVYGNAPNSVIMQWYDSLVKGSEIMHDLIVGNDTNYTWYAGGYKLLQALSGMTGVPLAAITREIASIWNTFVGAMAPSLKLKIYDGGEMNELKYAYKDGYLTDEEATALLLEKGLVDTEDEAYWKIQEWADSGDGFSKYDDVYDAVRNGGDFDAAMDELISHGVSEKDALSEVKGKIGEWYKGGEVSKQQATEMLKKYTKLTDKEIASAMNKWSCVVVTGIPFDDIKDEYLAGNISASRAAEMYSRYGGYELGAARETVSKWNFESKYGYTYSEIGQRFRDGELSAREMLNVMTTYGGKTMEEAQSSLLNYVRDGYDDGIFSENAAINMMVQYCGVDQDKALNKVRYINIRNQFPNIEIDDHWVSEYYDEIEPYGISPEIFFNYRDTVKGITGEGKKQNRMAVIDSLPISSSQKDALYYAEGWAASRIYEAHWH